MPSYIKENINLAKYTTLGVGGCARYFAEIATEEELVGAIEWVNAEGLKIVVLGGGSNVLIADGGIDALVVRMGIQGIVSEARGGVEEYVHACAGELWDDVVATATEERILWGIENLSGIPGRVGATPVQNINAYGASVSDVIVSVDAYHSITGERCTFEVSECHFGYRDSFFKTDEGSKYIIVRVTLKLTKEQQANTVYRSASQSIQRFIENEGITTPTPSDVRRAVLSARKNIGMLPGMLQSAGSFFKNVILEKEEFTRLLAIIDEKYAEKAERLAPWHWALPDGREKVSTAFLMECTQYNKTDFKGKTFNNTVGISPLHTLSLINCGGASSDDISAFVSEIISEIQNKFGVTIEPEVCNIP